MDTQSDRRSPSGLIPLPVHSWPSNYFRSLRAAFQDCIRFEKAMAWNRRFCSALAEPCRWCRDHPRRSPFGARNLFSIASRGPCRFGRNIGASTAKGDSHGSPARRFHPEPDPEADADGGFAGASGSGSANRRPLCLPLSLTTGESSPVRILTSQERGCIRKISPRVAAAGAHRKTGWACIAKAGPVEQGR